ncbi:MAG: HlyC/CorC family transporter [Sedimentisphaerales bacterium]|nr:HlyC/CorC family transporter [Sedimentisphaerales bacterium]
MSYIGWTILGICVLAFGTCFFSVAAIALRIFSPARLHDAFKHAKKASQADKLIKNSEKIILACSCYRLIFTICIIMLLLWLFSAAPEHALDFIDYLLSFIVSLAVFSIFSLIVPHACAKYAGEKILCKSYLTLRFFTTLLWPALYVFGFYDRLIKRLAGITETTEEERLEEKEEEFLTDLENQRIDGVVDVEEQEMIENVLELTDTTAGEILTPRTDVTAIEASSDLNTILEIITKAGHSRYPVFEENIDKIIGLVYAKDLLTEIGNNLAEFRLTDKLRDAYFVPETKSLRELLHEFQNTKQHIAVVLDEYGGTAGIVTLEDILEELVGEITDEYEKTPPKPVRKVNDDTIETDARIYIDDLNDEFELGLPEDEDYDTIGGFVFSYLGYIPKTDEQFEYKNLRFVITEAEPRKIITIRIQKLPQHDN